MADGGGEGLIPFYPKKGQPPLHLREWTAEELRTAHRMIEDAEWRRREFIRMKEKADGKVS